MEGSKMTVEILTREKALPKNIAPTGIQYSVVDVEWNNALKRIKSSQGPVPSNLSGLYTSTKRANAEVVQFLKSLWDMSDEQAKKNKSKAA
jgi:hypothetical protein